MTPDELDELERLEQAATKGPWSRWTHSDGCHYHCESICGEGGNLLGVQTESGWPECAASFPSFYQTEDRDFIIALRNSFPALLSLARIGAAYWEVIDIERKMPTLEVAEWEEMNETRDELWNELHRMTVKPFASRKGGGEMTCKKCGKSVRSWYQLQQYVGGGFVANIAYCKKCRDKILRDERRAFKAKGRRQ